MRIWHRSMNEALRCLVLLLGLAVCVAPWAGCSSGNNPPLGTVAGTITLDGKPLADADVTFQPEGPGKASRAVTDDQGRYEIVYLNDVKGALVGPHLVMVTTAKAGSDDGSTPSVPEKLPKRYHSETTLKAEVVEGSNTFDFALESK